MMSEDSQPETIPPLLRPPKPEETQVFYPKEQTDKKLIAGILAIVLGSFGEQKFFLVYTQQGILMLVGGVIGFFPCGFPAVPIEIVGMIEGILYLTKTDAEFVRTYLIGRREWF